MMRVVLFLSFIFSSVLSLPRHGWDYIVGPNNSMLAGNWDINNPNFNNTDLWWADTIANSYAAVALNFNNADPSVTVSQARILNKINPNLKFLVYQNSHLGPITKEAFDTINSHPEWWARDDAGNPCSETQGYILNQTLPEVRKWYNTYPIGVFGDEAKDLLDGILSDDYDYFPYELKNTNIDRYDEWFAGKMTLGDEGRAVFAALNGGEIWANGAIADCSRYHNYTYNGQHLNYTTIMDHLDGGFLEGAGSFWYQNRSTGDWIPELFEIFLESVINASTISDKTVILHFSPGPSNVPILGYPANPDPNYNKFLSLTFDGPVSTPATADDVRQAAADMLVQALAPFLIVVNENVFLQYAWFYEVQDGNIPCPEGIECGMPSEWYPEFTRPLGPPTGPAVKNGSIWTREFAHASVYLDVLDRTASKITWHV